jgi:photosystem II stability/assembly factor-like uncharacterized protein
MKKQYAFAALGIAVAGLVAWSTLPAKPMSLSEISHVHGIGFDSAAPGTIFLATHNGLYRAKPDGTATAASSDRNDYMGFTPDPANAGRLLASGHPVGGGSMGVIVSVDGGATWAQLSTGAGGPVDFHAMTVSRADPNTMYGLYGGIQVSRDGGATWTIAGPGPERVIDLAASPEEADIVYAGTVGGLMQSSDGGETWTVIGPANVPASMVEAAGDGSVYAFFAGAGLFKLSAADGKWSQLASDFGESYILHLAADPNDSKHLVAVTENSAVLESTDGGMTFEPFGQ